MPTVLIVKQPAVLRRNNNFFRNLLYTMAHQARTIEAIGNLFLKSEKSNVVISKLAPATTPDAPYRKDQADVLYGNEVSARTSAISAEQGARASAISSEQSARASAISSEQSARANAIASEQQARATAVNTLSGEISEEEQARISAVSAEQSARQLAVQQLNADLDAEEQARANAISAEQSTRADAVSGLDGRLTALAGTVNEKIRKITSIIPNIASGENSLAFAQLDLQNTTAYVKLVVLMRKADKSNAYKAEFLVEADDAGVLSIISTPNTEVLHEDDSSYDFDVGVNGANILCKLTAPVAGGACSAIANIERVTVVPHGSVASPGGDVLLELKTDFNRVYLNAGVKTLKASFAQVEDLGSHVGKEVEVSGLAGVPVVVALASVNGNVALFTGDGLASVANSFYGVDCIYKVKGTAGAVAPPPPSGGGAEPMRTWLREGYSSAQLVISKFRLDQASTGISLMFYDDGTTIFRVELLSAPVGTWPASGIINSPEHRDLYSHTNSIEITLINYDPLFYLEYAKGSEYVNNFLMDSAYTVFNGDISRTNLPTL